MGLLSAPSNFGETWSMRVSPNAPSYINTYAWSAPNCPNPHPEYLRFSENVVPFQSGSGTSGMWSPGAPWEILIDISNYANKDMWINIPVMADDNYVLQLSKLIKQRLKPTLNVHVEIGLELWNTGPPFMGYYMLRQILSDEWLQKNPEKLKILGGDYCPGCNLDSTFNASRDRSACGYNDYTTMQRWMARRLKEMMEQFAVDWGWKAEGGVGVRIRATLAGQLGYGDEGYAWNIGPGLEFLARAYGADAPSKYLYSVSIAAYFKPGEPDGGFTRNLPVQQIIQNYSTYPSNYFFGEFSPQNYGDSFLGNNLEGVLGKAKINGLKMYAYEGGNEIGNGGSGGANGWITYDNAANVMKDPAFGAANTSLLNEWYSWFGDDALFIKNGDYVGGNNAYGISEILNEDNALRQSYITVSSQPAPPLTTKRGCTIGIPQVSTLDARKYAGYSSDWAAASTIIYETVANTDFSSKSSNSWEKPFLIRNEKSGVFDFSLQRKVQGDLTYDRANPTICNIYLNDKLVFNEINLAIETPTANGLGWTAPISLEIPYGVHAIRIEPILPTADKPGNFTNLINQISISQYKFTLQKECDVVLDRNLVETSESIVLYPNPTHDGMAMLHCPQGVIIYDAYLMDIQGKRVKGFSDLSRETIIDMTGISDGYYLLFINTDQGRVIRKIMKSK